MQHRVANTRGSFWVTCDVKKCGFGSFAVGEDLRGVCFAGILCLILHCEVQRQMTKFRARPVQDDSKDE